VVTLLVLSLVAFAVSGRTFVPRVLVFSSVRNGWEFGPPLILAEGILLVDLPLV
jgi:hypothetical protein